MWSKICFNLDQSKILSSGNGLKEYSVIFVMKPITNIYLELLAEQHFSYKLLDVFYEEEVAMWPGLLALF